MDLFDSRKEGSCAYLACGFTPRIVLAHLKSPSTRSADVQSRIQFLNNFILRNDSITIIVGAHGAYLLIYA
jgi:hypothetical protein